MRSLLLTGLVWLLFGPSLVAREPHRPRPGLTIRPDRASVNADTRFVPDRHARAGAPLTISRWAQFAYGPKYRGYSIGGSTPPSRGLIFAPGEPRYLSEGTWGMDFAPVYSRVELLWTHGRLYQDGQGQYEPDRRNWPFGLRYGPRR